ncbi:MAG: CooT family nickel-binding protein [Candidatus Bathyarchaeia archaeon]|nr:CooT family nickel-binding protein [Candidatus Bathyarchaeota archaeon]
MCLLKVYVDNPKTGERKLIADNVALIAIDGGNIRILNVEAEEKTLQNMRLTLIDALNSTVILEHSRIV